MEYAAYEGVKRRNGEASAEPNAAEVEALRLYHKSIARFYKELERLRKECGVVPVVEEGGAEVDEGTERALRLWQKCLERGEVSEG